jgi:hypothetical protein
MSQKLPYTKTKVCQKSQFTFFTLFFWKNKPFDSELLQLVVKAPEEREKVTFLEKRKK